MYSVKKDFLRNFAKFTGEHLCQRLYSDKGLQLYYRSCNLMKKETLAQVFSLNFVKFLKIPFYRPATLLKWGTATSVWKTPDEYSLSRNTNFRSTVQVYHFFLGSINFQCMFSLVKSSHQRCSIKKVFLEFSQNPQEKHLWQSLFFNKAESVSLQLYSKRGSGTGILLWVLRNF